MTSLRADEAAPSDPLLYRLDEGPPGALLATVERFREALFPALPADYVRSRLPFVAEPTLWLAERGGDVVGFKLAYRLSDAILFSWLGGVLPEARRLGVAAELMRLQHDHARRSGHQAVETRTRTSNTPMILLNLRHGFEIVGLEADAYGRLVLLQRKPLG